MNQARPKIGFHIMPGIELDLDDPLMEWIGLSRRGNPGALVDELLGGLLDHPHEERFARAPRSEYRDRKRWVLCLRSDQRADRIGITAQVQFIEGPGRMRDRIGLHRRDKAAARSDQ